MIVSGNTAVVEWFFQCDYEENVDGFDGVTIAEFDAKMKICELKEFQSKAEHYYPYGNSRCILKNVREGYNLIVTERKTYE